MSPATARHFPDKETKYRVQKTDHQGSRALAWRAGRRTSRLGGVIPAGLRLHREAEQLSPWQRGERYLRAAGHWVGESRTIFRSIKWELTIRITWECTDDCTSLKRWCQGRPWSSADANPPACQCRGHHFDPWSGKIPRAAGQLSPCETTTEPSRLNYWSRCSTTGEATAMRRPCNTMKGSPRSLP